MRRETALFGLAVIAAIAAGHHRSQGLSVEASIDALSFVVALGSACIAAAIREGKR